jgi:uncharacterized membrane protein YeaQ/YmgE (transglycosylase-associated protein family)
MVEHMGLISFLILGVVVGGLAKAILPGRVRSGWLSTVGVGVVGSMVGGIIGGALLHHGLSSLFSPLTWLVALGGSLLVLVVWRAIKGRSASRAPTA